MYCDIISAFKVFQDVTSFICPAVVPNRRLSTHIPTDEYAPLLLSIMDSKVATDVRVGPENWKYEDIAVNRMSPIVIKATALWEVLSCLIPRTLMAWFATTITALSAFPSAIYL